MKRLGQLMLQRIIQIIVLANRKTPKNCRTLYNNKQNMINSSEHQKRDGVEQQPTSSKKFNQMFKLSKFSVIHENRLFSVDKLLLSRNLEVKRYTTCNDKDAVTVTQIISNGVKTQIINTLTYINSGDDLAQRVTENRKRSTQQPKIKETRADLKAMQPDEEKPTPNEEISKGASKDSVKKIIKKFEYWIEHVHPQYILMKPILKSTTHRASNKKISNKWIAELSKYPQLRSAFLEFAKNDAKKWNKHSIANDQYKSTLKKYAGLCETQDEKSQTKVQQMKKQELSAVSRKQLDPSQSERSDQGQ